MLNYLSDNMQRLLFLCLSILLLFTACTSLFFYPQTRLVRTPTQLGIAYENVYFMAADGVRLHAWWLPASIEKVQGTVLFLHGNAENISTHVKSVAWLPGKGFNVFLFDYRGYGLSQGTPHLKGLHLDVEAALTTVISRLGASSKLIVFGQSLGASLAITSLSTSAHKKLVNALVIDSAFSSYREITREKLANFWLTWAFQWPFSLSVNNTYRPLKEIARLAPIPILIIHGTADKIIPVHHAQRLYAAASEPKQLWLIPNQAHIQSLSRANVQQRLLEFYLNLEINSIHPNSEF
ncbi:MAG: alpha/beta hydrolase [Gammaproteobacteria bacterium]|nr:MAG: alpha/beta hydrolase [Gammaproteobacteria bacterium]RKZ38210.1 MAG: alpha/beta hydrolase [Gammaproteobacteria bacterium]